jgi:hypothetical protein
VAKEEWKMRQTIAKKIHKQIEEHETGHEVDIKGIWLCIFCGFTTGCKHKTRLRLQGERLFPRLKKEEKE